MKITKAYRRFPLLLLISTAALCALPSAAQVADMRVDRTEIRIGEQATIRLSVPVRKDAIPQVRFPELGDTLVKHVEVLRQTPVDTLATGEEVSETRLEQRIFITSFDTGYYAIPPFILEIDGREVRTEAFLLTVETVEVDTTKGIYDLRDIYEVFPNWRDYINAYWPYAAGALILFAIIVATVVLILHFRAKKAARIPVAPPAPKRPAHELVLEALEKVQREKDYLRKRTKQYHTDITDALRDYIEAVFHLPAHELTSGQILSKLRYTDLPKGQMQELKTILSMADMVKFAKEVPSNEDNERSVAMAIAFVQRVHQHLQELEAKAEPAGGDAAKDETSQKG